MRIGLINTPDPEFNTGVACDPKLPLGLLYIASVLRAKGHEVRIFDCYATISTEVELVREIARFAPSIVASTPAGTVETFHEIAVVFLRVH